MVIQKQGMWMAFNYFKDSLDDQRTAANGKIIDYIKSLKDDDDAVKYPTSVEIGRELKLPHTLVSRTLRKLYLTLIETLYLKDLEIKKTDQTLLVHIPWSDENKYSKEQIIQFRNEAFSIGINFKILPRLGEKIRLPFIDHNIRFNSGCVTEISHEILGETHRILIEVHPFDTYYDEWGKLKAESDRKEYYRRESERQQQKKEAEEKKAAAKKTSKPKLPPGPPVMGINKDPE